MLEIIHIECGIDENRIGRAVMNQADTDSRIQTVCLIILAMIAVVVALYWLRPVIVPFVWALFLSVVIASVIGFLTQYLRLPRPAALTVILLLFFGLFVLLGGLVATSVSQFASAATQYEDTLEGIIKRVESAGLFDKLGIPVPEAPNFFSLLPSGALKGVLLHITNAMTSLLSKGVLVMIFVIFIIIGTRSDNHGAGSVVEEMRAGVQRYVSTKIIVSAITGLLTSVILWFLGIPYAISFGAFAFILNFIPTVGSIVSTLLPLPVLLFIPDVSTTTVILAIALPGIVQLGVGNGLEPKMMGRSLDLHPITVLLALMFWGMIWGFDGMILAVPITAVVKIVFEKIDITVPLANIMAGRLDGASGLVQDRQAVHGN